ITESYQNPFCGIDEITVFWENIAATPEWEAPDGLFWICGKRAYPKLPKDWEGSYTLGIIQPQFFLLPQKQGGELGVPV
ncbi:ENR1 protein, partial [Neodrepanis coruscans]|nr:ENR1 protein [Neodrepanis coruscans]